MSEDLFPNWIRGLGFTVKRRPEFSTIVHTSPSFVESRVTQSRNPRWHYELLYNYLKNYPEDIVAGQGYPDLQFLIGFFLAHFGQGDDFLFNDVQTPDNYVGPAMIGFPAVPNLDAQLQLVQASNSGIWYSPIQRKLAGMFYEDVTDLNGSITVYANGMPKTLDVDFSVHGPGLAIPGASFAGKYLQWNAQPMGPITAQFYFYWRMRYEMDEWELEKFMEYLWSAGGQPGGNAIKLVTLKKYPS